MRIHLLVFLAAAAGCGSRDPASITSTSKHSQPGQLSSVSRSIASSRIAGGETHTLELGPNGIVWSWGGDSHGQLGLGPDALRVPRNRPTPIKDLQDVISLAAGGMHSIALTEGGRTYAWGYNSYGQLGDGTTTHKSSPTETALTPAFRIVEVAAGQYHSLALDSSGTLWTWGLNSSGQLGDNSLNDSLTPTQAQIPTGCNILQISAGLLHSLALCDDGTVLSWGHNLSGQLGRYTPGAEAPLPEAVPNLPPIERIASGSKFNLALTTSGELWVWGENQSGQLGTGDTLLRDTPTRIALPVPAVDISCGARHSLILGADGAVYSMGFNFWGQLGRNNDQTKPFEMSRPFLRAASVSASGDSSFIRATDGTLWALGRNSNGQLGDGSTSNSRSHPVQISPFLLAVGHNHTLIRDSEGKLRAWGENTRGQLGINTFDDTAEPTIIDFLASRTIVDIAAGKEHTLALTANGEIWGWGDNTEGQLGIPHLTHTAKPRLILQSSIIAIAAGAQHSLALTESGNVISWGRNDRDQLGHPDNSTLLHDSGFAFVLKGIQHIKDEEGNITDTVLIALDQIVSISAKNNNSAGTTKPSVVWFWGDNSRGQLGRGHTNSSEVALDRGFPDAPVSIAVGGEHSVVVSGRFILTCGANSYGQLGDDSTNDNWSCSPLTTLEGLIPAAGLQHSFSIHDGDGGLFAWGRNDSGQVGEGGGTFQDVLEPINVQGEDLGILKRVVLADGGECHSVAIQHDGTIWSWGCNHRGQLGNDLPLNTSTPQPVPYFFPNLEGTIASGDDYAFSLERNQTLGWGRNHYGRIGDGSQADHICPVRLGDRFRLISAGVTFAAGINHQGETFAWGDNTFGQFGDPAPNPGLGRPAVVKTAMIDAGLAHALAVDGWGRLWSWGANSAGALGTGDLHNSPIPVWISSITNPASISAGDGVSLVATGSGAVFGWGDNTSGQLTESIPVGLFSTLPVRLQVLEGIRKVSLPPSGRFALALDEQGVVWSWGANDAGQLGHWDGFGNLNPVPRPIEDPNAEMAAVIDIASYESQAMALDENGNVWIWGELTAGMPEPFKVDFPCTVVEAAVGSFHVLARCDDGSLWGMGNPGSLGIGNPNGGYTPVEVLATGPGCP